jgi:hypothetical protein
MGLLDDAIREHLELKRRRGADPDDVARQEQEALGPPRRGEFAQPDEREAGPAGGEPEAPAAVAAGRGDEDAEPLDLPEPPEPEPPPPPPDLAAVEPPPATAAAPPPPPAPPGSPAWPADPPGTARYGDDEEPWLDEPDEVPPADRLDHEQRAREDEPGAVATPDEVAPSEDQEEDVLEETPEFLQETPEHDRLWFEQRPPRDFDFDK